MTRGTNGKGDAKPEIKLEVKFDWRDLLRRAEADLQYAGVGAAKGYRLHAFLLCQRAVEKSLRALLIARGVSFPMTHKLLDLLPDCRAVEPEAERFRAGLETLDRHAGKAPGGIPGKRLRPTPEEQADEPTVGELDTALVTARDVLAWAKGRLGPGAGA